MWVGGCADQDLWIWENTDKPIDLAPWGLNEPNMPDKESRCTVNSKSNDYMLGDENCNNSYYYVCEAPAPRAVSPSRKWSYPKVLSAVGSFFRNFFN